MGFQKSYDADRWLQMGYFSGHLFLNMTEGTALSSGILGNSLEQYSLSIAGRVVEELVPKPPKSFPRRLVNTVRLTTFALTAGPHIRRLDKKLAATGTPSAGSPEALLAELDAGIELYNEATLTHVRSSSRSAVAANVLEDTVVKQAVKAGKTEDEGRARASALMAGATDVESAVMLAQLDEIVSELAADEQAGAYFLGLDAADAVTGLKDGDRVDHPEVQRLPGTARAPRLPRAVRARPFLGRRSRGPRDDHAGHAARAPGDRQRGPVDAEGG